MNVEGVEFEDNRIVFYDSRGAPIPYDPEDPKSSLEKTYIMLNFAKDAGHLSGPNLGRFTRMLEKLGLEREAEDKANTLETETQVRKLAKIQMPKVTRLAQYEVALEILNKQSKTLYNTQSQTNKARRAA